MIEYGLASFWLAKGKERFLSKAPLNQIFFYLIATRLSAVLVGFEVFRKHCFVNVLRT